MKLDLKKLDLNKNHYLYNPNLKDLSLYENSDKWTITGQEAPDYLRKHLIFSFEADVPPILDLFDKNGSHHGSGFFAMLRIIFPYLSWAGILFSPKGSETEKVHKFLKRYCDNKYDTYGKELYDIYRHGLMHRHLPNLIINKNEPSIYTWEINTDSSSHLNVIKTIIQCKDTGKYAYTHRIPICPRELYKDIHNALTGFAQSLEDGEGVKNFCEGFRSK